MICNNIPVNLHMEYISFSGSDIPEFVVPILISLIKDCSDLDTWSLSFCRHKKKKLIVFAGRTIKKWPPTNCLEYMLASELFHESIHYTYTSGQNNWHIFIYNILNLIIHISSWYFKLYERLWCFHISVSRNVVGIYT